MLEARRETELSSLVVCGFLGAGKSTLGRAIAGSAAGGDPVDPSFQDRVRGTVTLGDRPHQILEASPFRVPARGVAGQVVVTAIDAVNGAENLGDPDLGDLIADQIRAADLVVLTCGDVADPAAARRAIGRLTGAPLIEAHAEPDLTGAILAHARPRPGPAYKPRDHRTAFMVWSYSGSAVLTKDAMTSFVADRPSGAYRICGEVRLGNEGGRVDVFGRARRTAIINPPTFTRLTVAGPASRLSRREIDLAFAEAVAVAAYGRGAIACR